ncbi:MAG: hypothetical protein GF368_05090 [Candidatus Aenigmarchaeota archaeon]|nr:hypothetical protein [Candidatus Aenigmarchaeota archaeon]
MVFSDTSTGGGDTVGYYYMSHYIHEYLIPKGKLLGWAPGWFAGFPIFQFYFPLSFIISGILSLLIPVHVAFKIITMLGVLLLPFCSFFSFKFMKYKFPVPIIAAMFSLVFLFLEHYSMWGGNIPSTLAGEFSQGLSLSLMVLFFGSFYRGIKDKKYIIFNGILFALIVLSHGVITAYTFISSIFLLVTSDKKEFISRIKYFFLVYALAGMLSAFYLVPMILKSSYSIPHFWFLPNSFSEIMKMIFPPSFRFMQILALFGIFIGIKKKDKRIIYLTLCLLTSIAIYFLTPTLNNLEIPIFEHFMSVKFIPISYICEFLIAAAGLSIIIKKMNGTWLIPIILFMLTTYYVSSASSYISFWIKWNYSGFESKPMWESWQKVNDFLNNAGPGRVEFEYEDKKHDSGLGSSRAAEAFPVFSKSTLIGTNFQSAYNGPYIYAMECEYSKKCPCPLYLLSDGCLPYNLTNAKEHLELFNVKYLMAVTEDVKSDLTEDSDFEMVYGADELEVYELTTHDGSYVVPIENKPALIQSDEWREITLEWFKERIDLVDTPLVIKEKITPEDEKVFEQIIYDYQNLNQIQEIPYTDTCSVNEEVENEEIRITTDCIGRPLLVKISYFPNWKVEGAERVYRVSPAFMMIIPEQENVRLYYGKTWGNCLGIFASIIGVILVLILIFSKEARKIVQALIEDKIKF